MHTLLIANRGEIARRILRTAKTMDLRTVAVFTDLDAGALHAREADVSVRVESYLDVEEILRAARETRSDVIHPGYGFLSERAAFARSVEDAGLVLVGPSAEVMDLMGRKDRAREVAVAAGVPVVPSYDLESDPDTLDYPVLVKAAAGGGGKGMRVVHEAADLADALAAARREASAAFGDDTMLVEKYVESGRHIEVQVLADSHGHVVHLFERDCSTQRRHQKVLEEAPAPTITSEQREQVTSAAVALAQQVGYVNAGTVEFLLDTRANGGSGTFWFLEMNTRLQVEHPVTELVVTVERAPIDLVEMQLRVAAGAELGFAQSDVALLGHAIEARVYAEDSFGGFLPQAGTASFVAFPSGVRVDHALESGQSISTSYDPMLAKVIAHGHDRETARRRLLEGLDETVILGVTTNVGFLRALVGRDEFRDADIDTAWLDQHEVDPPDPSLARELAAWEVFAAEHQHEGPFGSDGFRLGSEAAPTTILLDEPVRLTTAPQERAQGLVQPHLVEVVHHGQRFVFERPDVRSVRGPAASQGALTAPMPGTVLAVDVAEGDRVEEGDRLGVLEAMKMELVLRAPFAGTVSAVGASMGDQVRLGAILFEVTPDD